MLNYKACLKGLFVKFTIYIGLFALAVNYENPSAFRMGKFIMLFGGIMGISAVRVLAVWLAEKKTWHPKQVFMALQAFYVIDIGLLFFVENYSRYAVNQFINLLYIFLILEIALICRRWMGIALGTLTISVSLYKYMDLLRLAQGWKSLSEILFYGLIVVIIMMTVNFAKFYYEEKRKKERLYNKIDELAVIEERNRIARDIHDSLGHNITATIMQMEMADKILDKDTEKARELLREAKGNAREGMEAIRQVLETLKAREEAVGMDELKLLVSEFSRKTGLSIEIEIDHGFDKLPKRHREVLFRIIQESMTNAVRHGNAGHFSVLIDVEDNGISFEVKDDGIGSENLIQGNGLKGMFKRVEALDGEIEFCSEDGFVIKGFIPFG